MARQYIGARYVPIIFDNAGSSDWVSGIAYEPLTIVTYLGNSFTSKKQVPSNIGDPASNPSYWVNTGNYNAQVATYLNEVLALQEKIEEKHVVIVGDSYANGYGGATGWRDHLASIIPTNWTLYDVAKNGIGFLSYNGNDTFDDVLTSRIGSIDTDKVSDVVIFAGYNDALSLYDGQTQTDLENAMYSFISRCETEFPNVGQIYVAFLGFTQDNSAMLQHLRRAQLSYRKCGNKSNKCTYVGILETLYYSNGKEWTDGSHHPSNAGNIEMAKQVKNLLNGSGIDVIAFFTCNATSSSYFTAPKAFNYYWTRNGIAYFKQGNITLNFTAAVTAGTAEIELVSTVDGTPIYRTAAQTEVIPVTNLTVAGTHYTNCYLRLEEGKVYLGCGTGLPAIAPGDTVVINKSSMAIPIFNY